jgi:hypothetical protein
MIFRVQSAFPKGADEEFTCLKDMMHPGVSEA